MTIIVWRHPHIYFKDIYFKEGWRHINDEMFKGIGTMFPRLGNMCINPTRRQQKLPGTHPKSNLPGFSAKGTLNSTTDNTRLEHPGAPQEHPGGPSMGLGVPTVRFSLIFSGFHWFPGLPGHMAISNMTTVQGRPLGFRVLMFSHESQGLSAFK